MTVKVQTKRAAATAASEWQKSRDRHVLHLFRQMARDLPAYKRFLKDRGIKPQDSTARDLSRIPVMSKDSYLRAYPYAQLFWGGSLSMPHIMTSTSGSTGDPFYFARSAEVDEASALVHERFFLQSSLSKTKSTLVIVCFGMGVWIGGLITYQAFRLLGSRGHPISVITPGINKAEIFKTLKLLAPQYDQIILAGYPPFVKDVLDEATEQGIETLRQKRVAIVCAAEAFTEPFREYLARNANIKNPLTDIMNIYGTAELGTMAAETPLSILIRQLAMSDQDLSRELFGDILKTPTLAQFSPGVISFEEFSGELFITGNSAMPLLRYALGDNGGVRSFDEIVTLFRAHGVDLKQHMREKGIAKQFSQLPFVFVYERKDLSTTLYGLQIYPETIREVLLAEEFGPFLTGRFTLLTKFDAEHDQYLEINVELRTDKVATDLLTERLLAEIVKNLRAKNGEFRELSNFLGSRAEPRVVFWPHEDPTYFRRDIKQKWVIRNQ